MKTLKIIALGVELLALCLFGGRMIRAAKGMETSALVFVLLSLMCALVHLYIGVKKAGYLVFDELLVLLAVFAVPAIIAFAAWWRLRPA